jgi:hypothetical protein
MNSLKRISELDSEIESMNKLITSYKKNIKNVFKTHKKGLLINNLNNLNNKKINDNNFKRENKEKLKDLLYYISECEKIIIESKAEKKAIFNNMSEEYFMEYYKSIFYKVLKILDIKNSNVQKDTIIKLGQYISFCYKKKVIDNVKISKTMESILIEIPIEYTENNVIIHSLENVN